MKYFLIVFFLLANAYGRELSLLEPGVAFEVGGSFITISDFNPAENKVSNLLTWANAKENMGFSGNTYIVANVHAKMALRLGFEILLPRTLNDIQGTYMGIGIVNGKTTTYSMIPGFAWDMFYYTSKSFRAFIGAEIGYAMLRSVNEWHYTEDAKAVGFSDFTERLSSSSVSVNPYAGIEVAFVDRYSFVLKLGYRVLKYRTLTADNGYTNNVDIAYSGNETVLNYDGTNRTYNFSGINVAASFRVHF
jgi:hypothetical protein